MISEYGNTDLSAIERCRRIVVNSVSVLFEKIDGGRIIVDNEASLQLQLAYIIGTFGEMELIGPPDQFSLELEKSAILSEGSFKKSGSLRANIDIWFTLKDHSGTQSRCAIELKYFKKQNHREPNNRYDVFKDFQNLEGYSDFADIGFLIVATDHKHYIGHKYSPDTADFDFSHGADYQAGRIMDYKTAKPYGPPIELKNSYSFEWQGMQRVIKHLIVEVPLS